MGKLAHLLTVTVWGVNDLSRGSFDTLRPSRLPSPRLLHRVTVLVKRFYPENDKCRPRSEERPYKSEAATVYPNVPLRVTGTDRNWQIASPDTADGSEPVGKKSTGSVAVFWVRRMFPFNIKYTLVGYDQRQNGMTTAMRFTYQLLCDLGN